MAARHGATMLELGLKIHHGLRVVQLDGRERADDKEGHARLSGRAEKGIVQAVDSTDRQRARCTTPSHGLTTHTG
eukprot:scaffold144661_cov20-Prasinocladus_malaysianus.AAC.1